MIQIIKTEGCCGGRARLEGRRITVWQIVIWNNMFNFDFSDLNISEEEIKSALVYYQHNKEEIDQDILDNKLP